MSTNRATMRSPSHSSTARRFLRLCPCLALSAMTCGCSAQPPFTPAEIQSISTDACFSNRKTRQLVEFAQVGNVAKVEAMIKDGAEVNDRGKWGMTPLFRVLVLENKQGYSSLLKHGADPNLRHVRGLAVIHEAALKSDPFWLKEALLHGGDPNLLDTGNPFTKNESPLFYAAHGKIECVKLLIASGANVNYRSDSGESPLNAASGLGSYDIVMALLEAGIDYQGPMGPRWFSLSDWVTKHHKEENLPDKQKDWYRKTREFLNKQNEKADKAE